MSATRFVRDVIFVGSADILRALRGLVVLPILAKILGAEGYGLWVQLQVTVVLLACLVRLGLKESVVRFLGGEQGTVQLRRGFNTAVWATVLVAVVTAAGLCIFAEPVAAFVFQGSRHAPFVRLMAPLVLLEAVDQLALAYLQAVRRMGVRATALILEVITEVVLIGALAIAGFPLAGIVGWLVGWKGLFVLLKLGTIWSGIGLSGPTRSTLTSYVGFGLPLMAAGLLYLAMQSSDRYFVNHFVGLQGVGMYAAAYAISNLLVILLTPLDYVLYPTIAGLWRRGEIEGVRVHVQYAIKYALLLGIPVLLIVTRYAERAISLFSIAGFVAAGVCVPVIGTGLLLLIMGLMAERILQLANRSRLLLGVYAGLATVNVLLNAVLVPTLGIRGAAIATLLTFGSYAACTVSLAQRWCRLRLAPLVIGKGLLAGCAMALVMHGFNGGSLGGVMGAVVVGGAVYVGLLAALGGFDQREMRFLRELIGTPRSHTTTRAGREVTGRVEAFYKQSDQYQGHLQTHDEAFFSPYRTVCQQVIPSGSRILDLGCGLGQSSRLLAGDLKGQVVACDLSLKFLQTQLDGFGRHVHPVVGNGTALPFRTSSFDAVAACHFIEHVPEVESVLQEMVRLVRPGGHLIVVSPNLLSPFPWIKDLVWKCGGRTRRAGWSRGWGSLFVSLLWSTWTSVRKLIGRRIDFLFREPDLGGGLIGGDADSVYLANPMDLAKWLRRHGCQLRQVAVGATWGGRVTARLCPWWSGLMGLVAQKS